MYKYAEISKESNAVITFGEAPFVPEFAPNHPTYCIDITDITPEPQAGYIYDPESGTFTPPPPIVEPDPYDGYLGDLILESVTGGQFVGGVPLSPGLTADNQELNVAVWQPVVVTGRITDKHGQLVDTANMPTLRIPILPTDINGQPLPSTQPSLAIASIEQGIVTARWEPEFTGTYAITEDAINVRLPQGARLKFSGLQVFVLPGTHESEGV